MTARLTPLAVTDDRTAVRALSRSDVVDAAARCITRRGDHRIPWVSIAYEAGNAEVMQASEWFEDLTALIDECYARTAQGLSDCLLRAETAPGTALDKVAAFVVAALEVRRARGAFLSFRRGADLPVSLQRRLHEHDTVVRTRLKRLLNKGRRDGSLALRNLDSAVELLLASLQVPTVVVDGPQQHMWDSELVELLLAALAEPHPPEPEPRNLADAVHGSCLCGSVRYELHGSVEVMSHCHCAICHRHRGTVQASYLSVPLVAFQWISGEAEVTVHHSAACGTRAFCRQCGSAAPIVDGEAGIALCPAGELSAQALKTAPLPAGRAGKLNLHPPRAEPEIWDARASGVPAD